MPIARRLSRICAAVATTPILMSLLSTPVVAHAAPVTQFINLQQCVYNRSGALYTNLLPNTNNPSFNTGTNVSPVPTTGLRCGPGAFKFTLDTSNSAALTFDLSAGSVLNLHQCVYNNRGALYTNLLSNTFNVSFNTGTNLSSVRDTVLRCGPGAFGFTLDTSNSALLSLDLSAGSVLNLHQCVYNSRGALYTNLLPNTPNVSFNTGTNLSSVTDTALRCGPG